MYRDSEGYWDGVKWDGEHATFFALRETSEGAAEKKLRLPALPDSLLLFLEALGYFSLPFFQARLFFRMDSSFDARLKPL